MIYYQNLAITLPIGTHEAVVNDVSYNTADKRITIFWYIPSVDKTIKQIIYKDQSFLSEEQKFRRTMCRTLDVKKFDFSDLIDKHFLIKVSLTSDSYRIEIKKHITKGNF